MSAHYYGHMGSDDMVCDAARVSFDKSASEYSQLRNEGLLRYLAEHRHMLPFRHPQISFRMRAPIFVARQLGKHQVGLNWSEVSRRYVTNEPQFYDMLYWRERPAENIKQGSGGYHPEQTKITLLYERTLATCKAAYQEMLRCNVAPEQARAVLPQAMMTEWLWTGSLLAWAHLYRERITAWAQDETSDIVSPIGNKMRELFPISWRLLTETGPKF